MDVGVLHRFCSLVDERDALPNMFCLFNMCVACTCTGTRSIALAFRIIHVMFPPGPGPGHVGGKQTNHMTQRRELEEAAHTHTHRGDSRNHIGCSSVVVFRVWVWLLAP